MKWNLYVVSYTGNCKLTHKVGRGEGERAEGIQFLNSYVAYL